MKTSSKIRTQRQPVEPRFPRAEEWQNIVHDCSLTPAQEDTLKIVLKDAIESLSPYQAKLRNEPSRPLLIDRLKKFERALARLHDECCRNVDLMQHFLPHGTREYVGRSMTFSAMNKALRKNVIPRNFDQKIAVKRSVGERITVEFMEEFSRPSREAIGLKHGHLILKHFVEQIHAPLTRWIELKSLDQGGRPADAVRNYSIYQLAEAAPEIIGKPARIAVTGKFVDLCTSVFQACGLPEDSVGKAVPPVVRKLRANQAKWRPRPLP